MEPVFDLDKLNKEMNVVYKYLRKLNIPHVDAQDIVQETTYKFLLYYDTIRTSNIRGWLIRVALNVFHDQCRKNKYFVLAVEDKIDFFTDNNSPEDIVLVNENKSLIYRTLNLMKPKYREVIFLKYIIGLKYEDISRLLDMKLNTVKTYLARARKEFIKIYRRMENEQ